MKLRAGAGAIAFCVAATVGVGAQPPVGAVLASDLSFHFVCRDANLQSDQLDTDLKRHLADAGFKVLDKAKARREHGIPSDPATDIVALDGRQRYVMVTSLPSRERRYALSLTSRPPTQHTVELEEALLRFVRERLRCETRQVARSENGADATEFYEFMVKRIEGWFEQDERYRGERRL